MHAAISGAVIAFVFMCGSSAHAQTYRYKFTTDDGEKSHYRWTVSGTMVVKKGPNTSNGYMTYHGHRKHREAKKTVRVTASVLGVKTSKGLRFFGAYGDKKPFWLFVFRTSPRGVDVTRLDASGRWDRATRVTGKDLTRGIAVTGKNKSGIWRATAKLVRTTHSWGTSQNFVTWRSKGKVLKGHGCLVGDTVVVALGLGKNPDLYCYALKGRNLSGSAPSDSDSPVVYGDTLTRLP